MKVVLTQCRLCETPTNRLIWCSDVCMVWNMLLTKDMIRRNKYPSREEWDRFCVDVFGEVRPMFSYKLDPEERRSAAIYQEEDDPRWKKLTTV